MKFAARNGIAILAKSDSPKAAKCVYCGEPVKLASPPNITGFMWLHLTDNDTAKECQRLLLLGAPMPAGLEDVAR